MPQFVSFNVGPSQLDAAVPGRLQEIAASGLLSLSHRGREFEAVYAEAEAGLRSRLDVPADYRVYFVSSATESWSVLAECLVRTRALHLWSGSFGERWAQQAQRLHPATVSIRFGVNDDPAAVPLPTDEGIELVALTHNETSNTTKLSDAFIQAIRGRYPDAIVAVDVTSSLGGDALPWAEADVWFGSVQKCLGLPAGLGVLICGPRAVARAAELNVQVQYNNLVAMEKYAQKHQTTHTPNVLGIALLAGVLRSRAPIADVSATIATRAQAYYALIDGNTVLRPLVTRGASRSTVTIGVQAKPQVIERVKAEARAEGLLLASGYGEWKSTSLRIANFPALGEADVARAMAFLNSVR